MIASELLGAVAVGAALAGPHGLGWVLDQPPMQTAALLVGVAGALYATVLVYTQLPRGVGGVERRMTALVERVGELLARRTSRRGALSKAAVAGAAFAVAPVRYLIRPGTAWAVIQPQDCPPGAKCRDGYTAFCCEIEQGNNACPPNTYIAGWWKCTSYHGNGLCDGQGVRYYIDCNRIPGTVFPGGLPVRAAATATTARSTATTSATGSATRRSPAPPRWSAGSCCAGTRPRVPGMNCNGTEMVDNRTCTHENPCLQGLAKQLPGGGGA